jgi:hypothetical protein
MKFGNINKKAQVGSTLTWFIAFLIIFFIIILFVFASLSLAGRKKFIVGNDDLDFNSLDGRAEGQRTIFVLLESSIEIEGVKKKYSEFLKQSLNPYIEDDRIVSSLQGDINSLDGLWWQYQNNKEFNIAHQNRLIDQDLFKISKQILINGCDYAYLRIPQGNTNLKEDKIYTDFDLNTINKKEEFISNLVIPWAQVSIPYNDYIINVNYTEAGKC